MANYECATCTNYFKVKDEEAFLSLMKRVYGWEDFVEVFRGTKPGTFGFGCYGGIGGLRTDDNADPDEETYDDFLDELQKCVADEDAAIIYETGNEKLRYLVGSAIIVTSKATKYIDIQEVAVAQAKLLLGNDTWETED